MQLYPTIHIKNGRCYNPVTQDTDRPNIFTSSPVRLAKIWEDAGASRLHIVDVDGAVLGQPMHNDVIAEIADNVNIPIQAGGGVRTLKDFETLLNLGVDRVVCGTKGVTDKRFVSDIINAFGKDKIVVGIDALNGMVAIEGREKLCRYNAISLTNMLGELGVQTVIYTDVVRSSISGGPVIENTKELVARTGVDIIYAGGVTDMEDIRHICQTKASGVVIASALYNGNIDLNEALRIFEKGQTL